MMNLESNMNSTNSSDLDNAIALVVASLREHLFDNNYRMSFKEKSEVCRAFGLIEGYAKMAEQYAFHELSN